MDKSAIPTKTVSIGKDDTKREVKVYEWLTQKEEDEYISLLTGGQAFTPDESGSISMTTTAEGLAASRNYLIEHYCIDLSMDEYNYMNPKLRADLNTAIEDLRTEKK